MPAVSRLGDSESHNSNTLSASSNVFCNGNGVCRVDDTVGCGLDYSPHPSPGIIISGSSSVFVNGKSIARVGDQTEHTSCGNGSLTSGSNNVYSN